MPKSGSTLERAQEDYEKGLKIEQDFAEYFTGTVYELFIRICIVCVLGIPLVRVLVGHA